MKKAVLVFLVAVIVLLIFNNLTLADDNLPAAIRGIDDVRILADEECQKITGKPIIPPDSKKELVIVDSEEQQLKLYSGVYWIVDREEKIQALKVKGLKFIPLRRGVYVLYTAPEKSSPAMEIMRRRALQRP